MRMTVLQQTAKGLPDKTSDGAEEYPLCDTVVRALERLKWFLWQGNVEKALQVVPSVEMDLDSPRHHYLYAGGALSRLAQCVPMRRATRAS